MLGVVIIRVDLLQAVDVSDGLVILLEQHAGGDQIVQRVDVLIIQLIGFLESGVCEVKGFQIPEHQAHFVMRHRLVRVDPEAGAVIFQGLLRLAYLAIGPGQGQMPVGDTRLFGHRFFQIAARHL